MNKINYYYYWSTTGWSSINHHNYTSAGHPRSGCPARLRGHKGSGLWKVWTVPSPPPLPRAKFDQAGSSRLAEITARRSARVKRRPGDQRVDTKAFRHVDKKCGEKCCFENVELRELWFESGLMNGPLHTPQGRWSECHRVRNAKRPKEGSSSRTASYY